MRIRSAVALALTAVVGPAQGAPAASLTELQRQLAACTRVHDGPPAAVGSTVTVLFALRRDGSLQGRPRITHAHLTGDARSQRMFLAAALSAVANCVPAVITEGLGGAIAGRPLSLRIGSRVPDRAI